MRNIIRYLLFFVFPFLALLHSCSDEPKEEKKIIIKAPQDVNAATSKELNSIITRVQINYLVISNDTLLTFPYFKDLYKDNKTLYSDKGKLNALGDTLFTIIKEARFYGLIPDQYHFQKIDALLKQFYNKKEDNYDARAIAHADLLLTDAFFKLGAHLNKGRFYPDSLMLEWRPEKLDKNWDSILRAGILQSKLRSVLDSLEPKHEGYLLLKKELKKFILENEKVDWDSVSFYNISDTLVFLNNLKNRLVATGDYDSTITGSDSLKMAAAIKSFQNNNNLDPDGKLGKYTKQMLQLTKETTIRQMEMALERWRWENKKFPDRYFWVNIPSADLHIYEHNYGKFDSRWKKTKKQKEEILKTLGQDTLVLYSKIVVGKPETPTPVLNSKISYMLIYPYWNVPYSIAWKEILPAVQRDTTYLRRKKFEVIGKNGTVIDPKTINWKKLSKFNLPYKFRQRIGDDNSLGVVKFNFNNKYGVYLHDTNSKRYFKTFYRFQSHGCIRLDKYWETAKFLAREDTAKIPYDTLAVYFATPEQRKIDMKKYIPIYVRYYSAVADTAGLHFYLDIYRKDEKMWRMLYKEPSKK